MFDSSSHSLFYISKNAAGVAGNIFAFGLFVSPIPTFKRIVHNQSTEHFSGLPYIYALLNCLICIWYGMPFISPNNTLIVSVNSIGALFQSAYIILFISHADKPKKIRMIGLLIGVISVITVIATTSLKIPNQNLRKNIVGILSVASLISMFASPLFIVRLVIQTKSVEFMPFYLSLSTFLMSASFFVYGLIGLDFFIYMPNGIGTMLGTVQLLLYSRYKRSTAQDASQPFISQA